MTNNELQELWELGRSIQVRYKFSDLEWVDIPKKGDEGMLGYDVLSWDTNTYEYEMKVVNDALSSNFVYGL